MKIKDDTYEGGLGYIELCTCRWLICCSLGDFAEQIQKPYRTSFSSDIKAGGCHLTFGVWGAPKSPDPRTRYPLGTNPQHYLGTIADRLLLGSLVQAMANPFIQVRCLCDHLSDLVHSAVLRLSQGMTDGFIGQMVSFLRAAAPTSTTGQTFPNIPLLSCFLSQDFRWRMAGQRSCSPLVNPTPSGDISTGWL